MGWKTIKEHYRITHIVQKVEDKILIGSPYVSNLITIFPSGEVKWASGFESSNENLARYFKEMSADPEKVRTLWKTEDNFGALLPVYTHSGHGSIELKWCEERGYPNCTTDGCLMYEGHFFASQGEAVLAAKRDVASSIGYQKANIRDAEQKLEELRSGLKKRRETLAKLNRDFPDFIQPEADEEQ